MLLPFPHGARCWIQIDSKRKPLWAPEAELSTRITPLISVGPPRLGFFSAEENDPQKYQAKAGIISFSSPLLLPWTWLALYEIFIATLCTYLKQEKIKLKLKNCGKYIYIYCAMVPQVEGVMCAQLSTKTSKSLVGSMPPLTLIHDQSGLIYSWVRIIIQPRHELRG